ncbi:hypothetical protein GCM10023331_01520 [Algivirga pacifica]|uniref:DNA-binding beta-propeller fold protein YncE n=2 Tax=Algivirga pacifica TaxID=1162670 RepID=A0ABP9CYN9_9BACT
MILLLANGIDASFFQKRSKISSNALLASAENHSTSFSPYTHAKVQLTRQQLMNAQGRGIKSVLLSPDKSKIYSLNLEGLSVYEYDRKSRKLNRELRFKPTQGKGYNYQTRQWYSSMQEKPVEGCFSHDGKYLWVSLHNAGGIVAWNLHMVEKQIKQPIKEGYVVYSDQTRQLTQLKFIETGTTPKYISLAPEGDRLFVSNWHSNTISVIDISSDDPNDWKKIKDLKTKAVPRGIVASPSAKKLFSTNMASNSIMVRDMETYAVDTILTGYRQPRHLLEDEYYLYATLSSAEKLIKINKESLELSASCQTADDPRTIAFSEDKSLIFCTCYGDNKLEIYRAYDLEKVGEVKSYGGPVGVATYQEDNHVEVWVCNYKYASISIFDFDIVY